MDINALLCTILSKESVSGVASQAGVKKKDAKSILGSALPMLLNGANAQSTDETTSESFANALAQHAQNDTSNIKNFFKNIDLKDGAKIISHLLGSTEQEQTSDVANKVGVSTSDTGNVLSSVAPFLMSLIGQQTASDENSGAGVGSLMGALLGGGDITSLIGGLLGTGNGKKKKNGILSLLASLFGKK